MNTGVTDGPAVELWWLPLGAGGSPLVRVSGRCYERWAARRDRREPQALVHAALRVRTPGAPWRVVEVAPEWDRVAEDRGAVAGGPVGARVLGRSVWFRYEVRCWAGGVIPDAAFVVGGAPVALPTGTGRAERLVELVAQVPTPTWGRDELGAGEMWNSNSVVAWLLLRSGHALPEPPPGHRAPGWSAGVVVARRDPSRSGPSPLPIDAGRS